MPDKSLKKDLIVEEWIKKANDDELNAVSILKHRDGTPNCVCFLSQQTAEKYLKAFLVQEKKKYPKIHPLDALWELCKEIDKSFEEIKKKFSISYCFLYANSVSWRLSRIPLERSKASFRISH